MGLLHALGEFFDAAANAADVITNPLRALLTTILNKLLGGWLELDLKELDFNLLDLTVRLAG